MSETAEVRARFARNIRTEHDRTWQSGADEFDEWVAEHDRRIKEAAWDAAVSASRYAYENTRWFENPYRDVKPADEHP